MSWDENGLTCQYHLHLPTFQQGNCELVKRERQGTVGETARLQERDSWTLRERIFQSAASGDTMARKFCGAELR